MSDEHLQAFADQLKSDPSLQAKLKQAYAEAIVSTARQAGYTISTEQLQKLELDISDEELKSTSAGVIRMSEALPILSRIQTPGLGLPQ